MSEVHEYFTATAGWVSVSAIPAGFSVVRESTGQAAACRPPVGADEPAIALSRALEAVGVRGDEAIILARVHLGGGNQ